MADIIQFPLTWFRSILISKSARTSENVIYNILRLTDISFGVACTCMGAEAENWINVPYELGVHNRRRKGGTLIGLKLAPTFRTTALLNIKWALRSWAGDPSIGGFVTASDSYSLTVKIKSSKWDKKEQSVVQLLFAWNVNETILRRKRRKNIHNRSLQIQSNSSKFLPIKKK